MPANCWPCPTAPSKTPPGPTQARLELEAPAARRTLRPPLAETMALLKQAGAAGWAAVVAMVMPECQTPLAHIQMFSAVGREAVQAVVAASVPTVAMAAVRTMPGCQTALVGRTLLLVGALLAEQAAAASEAALMPGCQTHLVASRMSPLVPWTAVQVARVELRAPEESRVAAESRAQVESRTPMVE